MSDDSNILLLTFIHLTSTARLVVFGEGSHCNLLARFPRDWQPLWLKLDVSHAVHGYTEHVSRIRFDLLAPRKVACTHVILRYYCIRMLMVSQHLQRWDIIIIIIIVPVRYRKVDLITPSPSLIRALVKWREKKKTITVLTEMRIDCSAR